MGVASNITKFEALTGAIAGVTAVGATAARKNKSVESELMEDFSEEASSVSNCFSVDKAFGQMMSEKCANEVLQKGNFQQHFGEGYQPTSFM